MRSHRPPCHLLESFLLSEDLVQLRVAAVLRAVWEAVSPLGKTGVQGASGVLELLVAFGALALSPALRRSLQERMKREREEGPLRLKG